MNAWVHDDRKYLTDQQRARLFFDRGGRCEVCTRKIGAGEKWEADHRIARENGGNDAKRNWQVICRFCHKIKTKEDHGKAAKSRAIATAHVIPNSQRRDKIKMRRPPPGWEYDWKVGRYRKIEGDQP